MQESREMSPVVLPAGYNYCAAFLTFACNLHCSYCINRYESDHVHSAGHMSGEEWVASINRIVSRPDLPLTLQGGEPTLHKDFYYIVNNIKPELNIDLLTNLQFDPEVFMANVPPGRIKREAPYASIRVSYHPHSMDLDELVKKTLLMLENGYSIGIWGVLHPSQADEILRAQALCLELGIDFRTKEFLGFDGDVLHGTYRYEGAVEMKYRKNCLCKTTELVMGPDGGVYRCHSDLYEGRPPVGNISDPAYELEDVFRPCAEYGHCNPCDIKLKTNRFQQFGHCSVVIEELEE